MKADLVNKILEGGNIRELLDAASIVKEDAVSEPANAENAGPVLAPDDEDAYRHLFVRRFKADDTEPYKRARVESADEALKLFFTWVDQYRSDRCEIWSDVAQDAKNFYRYCVKNRESLEPLWKGSTKVKKAGVLFPAAYRDIVTRARQSGTNLVGTLYPFEVAAK